MGVYAGAVAAGGVRRGADAVRVDALVVEGRADATAGAAVARVGRGVDALIAATGEARLALALRIHASGVRRADVAASATVVRVGRKVTASARRSDASIARVRPLHLHCKAIDAGGWASLASIADLRRPSIVVGIGNCLGDFVRCKRGEIVLHGLQGPNAVSAGIARAAAAVGENCIPDQGVSKEHAPVVRARAAALRLISRSGTDVTHPRLTSVHGEVRGRVDQE